MLDLTKYIVNNFAKGQLNVSIDEKLKKRKDELGNISVAIDDMRVMLNGLMVEIKNTSNWNVYNISGQKVITLVDANKDKGTYTVELSASQLPEGIYTYTLELDGSIIERNKMVLVK